MLSALCNVHLLAQLAELFVPLFELGDRDRLFIPVEHEPAIFDRFRRARVVVNLNTSASFEAKWRVNMTPQRKPLVKLDVRSKG